MWQRISTSAILLVVHLVTGQECIDGEFRTVPVTNSGSSTHTDIPQYCSNGEWMMFCTSGAATYTQETLDVMCRHLGYSDQGASNQTGGCSVVLTVDFIRPSAACTGTEHTIQGCSLETLESCSCNDIVRLECQPATAADGDIRLFAGSTKQEGTVQVHRDGRWETVCTNSQEGIAGAVCSQVGFSAEGALVDFLGPTTPPSIICTIQSGADTLQCTNTSCDHLSPSLGVVCKSHQEVVEVLMNQTRQCEISLNEQTKTIRKINETLQECSTQQCEGECTNDSPSQTSMTVTTAVLGTFVGLLVISLLIAIAGWIVTCHKLSRASAQKCSEIQTLSNDCYSLHQTAPIVHQTSVTPGGEAGTNDDDYELVDGIIKAH